MNFAYMSFSTPELTLQEMLDTAKEMGYVAIEPRLQSAHKHGIETSTSADERRTIRETAEASGVAIGCLAVSNNYANPDTRDENIEGTVPIIDLAGDLGCHRLRVFGGACMTVVDRDEAIAGLAAGLAAVADHAASRDVILCVETHDDWCDAEHVAAVMAKVDHPAIATNWDIMHPVMAAGYTMQKSFEILKPWIKHVHVHDGTKVDGELQLRSIGEGDIDHGVALKLLHEMGYDDLISGEWIGWEPWQEHLPRELALLKALDPDVA